VFYWIYDYPTAEIGLLFAVVFVAFSLTGMFLFRTIVHGWIHSDHRTNEMVGLSLESFSVLYGILLGLVAVGTYQNFSSISDLVTKEASCLASLYRDASALPEPQRTALRRDIRNYTRFTIDHGWPAQRHGMITTGSTRLMTILFNDLVTVQPADKRGEIVFAEAFRQYNNLTEVRRARLASVTTGIPAVLWWVVGIGAFLNIVLIWMLDMEIHVHAILATLLSLFLGVVIFLVAAMDNPFRGEVSVGPDALELVYRTLMTVN
jgi:hypothetical protein